MVRTGCRCAVTTARLAGAAPGIPPRAKPEIRSLPDRHGIFPDALLNERHFRLNKSMRTSEFIARMVTQRRGSVWLGILVLAVLCVVIFISHISLDSDVLNMLPGGFSSVEGLKIYNRDFEQTRDLTFALQCQPNDVDKLDEFAPLFVEKLREQSWCERVLAGSPRKPEDGARALKSIAFPLLLTLEPPVFQNAMSILQPEKLGERLH